MVLDSVSAASLDFGKNINTLVKTGAIETIKDSMQQASRLGLPVVSFQTKLASGIPEEFIENLNHISNLSITNYEMLLDENEVTLFEHQLEQNITEINQELRDNPDGIWVKLNSWATEILEAPTALKEKLPFVFLILQIIFLIGTFVIVQVAQDLIKDKVLHELNLKEKAPAKNAKNLKESLSKDLDNATSYINKVRVTNRETFVFRSDKRKSGKIDTIPINKPVIIVNKNKNWCLVIYVNKHQEEVIGWVFTGNLTR
ncbi:hypothetical protein [Bacillus altitudinis]|uniref:hypothetical protein n=1 Tax=Bacillus altitudinis TaxID=293387 RepID=UPI003314E885